MRARNAASSVSVLLCDLPLLGRVAIAAGPDGLKSLQAAPGETPGCEAAIPGPVLALLEEAREQLGQYLAGRRTRFALPLAPEGTDFQKKVWHLLCGIPYGCVRTYGEIARDLGSVRLARAVGGAVGRNNLPLIIPCHRVVAAGGHLGGFSMQCADIGGPDLKARLLELEGRTGFMLGQ